MTNSSINRRKGSSLRMLAASVMGFAMAACAHPAVAQDVMQLTVPAPEYTLGRFKYQVPKADGWRQLANVTESLSLVYAEQKEGEGTIDTRFGVAMEVHEIPPEAVVENAAGLAELSRKQVVEARKADLVAQSAIAPVPSIENLYTYRLLVHSPIKDQPDVYEVYYVAMAPDKTEYVVIQCITKNQDYEGELYFNQFYGSLASLKYTPPSAEDKDKAKAKAAATAAPTPAPVAPPAATAPPAPTAAPAGH